MDFLNLLTQLAYRVNPRKYAASLKCAQKSREKLVLVQKSSIGSEAVAFNAQWCVIVVCAKNAIIF